MKILESAKVREAFNALELAGTFNRPSSTTEPLRTALVSSLLAAVADAVEQKYPVGVVMRNHEHNFAANFIRSLGDR